MKTAFAVTGALAVWLLAHAAMAQTPTTAPPAPAGVHQANDGQWRVDKLIGLDVYNQNNEKLGDISGFLVDHAGKIQTVILGVGGFLGVGERAVAVDFDQLRFVDQPVEFQIASVAQASAGPIKRADLATPAATGAAPMARPIRSSSEKWYPDHAVINITADQLKALPRFEYN
jgi:sporulation protein YlmC with PRC-barrel domain